MRIRAFKRILDVMIMTLLVTFERAIKIVRTEARLQVVEKVGGKDTHSRNLALEKRERR